jgi:putative copper export protein
VHVKLSVTVSNLYCNERTAVTRRPCDVDFSYGGITNDMMTFAALLFAEADFTALDVLHHYIEFIGSFFIVGAVSFYFLLLRPALSTNAAAMTSAARTAARIGCIGALLRLIATAMSINTTMTEKHLSFTSVAFGQPSMIVGEVMTVIAVIAFAVAALATRESSIAWAIAGIATLVVMLGGLITTKIGQVVNPIHVFAASMWIGTLFVLVTAGITTALGSTMQSSERGPAVALLVNRFSTIALWSAGVLALTGVITAWIHLGSISALWTSIYGKTLIVKLCLVAIVFGLGAYNNQRLKPSLGTEEAGRRLTRSATFEVAIATLVLIVTAVLVNLPAPAEHM